MVVAVSSLPLVVEDNEHLSLLWAEHSRYRKGDPLHLLYSLDQALHSRGKKEKPVEVEMEGGQEEVVGEVEMGAKG